MGITVGKCGKASQEPHGYDFDMIVVGGGSGGLSVAREAAKLGAKVAVCDFVIPSGMGSRWGLGGTCVNVGCIPKKLMHQAALLGDALSDAAFFGWNVSSNPPELNWKELVASVQGHVRTLNWQYKVALFQAKVKFFHEFATFVDSHTLKCSNTEGDSTNRTANHIVIAVGGRPRYLDIPGGKKHEFTITSDDLFSLKYHPGKILVVGASFVAMECASFLASVGCEVTIMIRSVALRGMDRQIVKKVTASMEQQGIKFLHGYTPTKIEKIEDGAPPVLEVSSKKSDEELIETYNTVLSAIGRNPCTADLNLDIIGVALNHESKRIKTNKFEQTNILNIYAIGDVADARPELTPPAIKAGLFLARRLYGNSQVIMDYTRIPKTVYTTIEYSFVGMTEEQAVAKHGEHNVEIYHTSFEPLENALPQKPNRECYAKLICLKPQKERIVGFHYFGPNAGEVCQGFALSLRLGARKTDIDALTGIHPTCAEIFTTMYITKSSGVEAVHTNC